MPKFKIALEQPILCVVFYCDNEQNENINFSRQLTFYRRKLRFPLFAVYRRWSEKVIFSICKIKAPPKILQT